MRVLHHLIIIATIWWLRYGTVFIGKEIVLRSFQQAFFNLTAINFFTINLYSEVGQMSLAVGTMSLLSTLNKVEILIAEVVHKIIK